RRMGRNTSRARTLRGHSKCLRGYARLTLAAWAGGGAPAASRLVFRLLPSRRGDPRPERPGPRLCPGGCTREKRRVQQKRRSREGSRPVPARRPGHGLSRGGARGAGRRSEEAAGEEKRRRWDGGSGAAVRPHGPEQRPEAPLPVQRERQAAKALERTQARCGDLSLPPSLSPPIGSLAVLPPTRPVVAEHGWAGVKNGPWGLTCCPCQSRRSGSRCPCRGARPGGRSRRSAHWTRRSASASALSQSSPPPGHGTWPCCPHSCRRGCAITTSPAPQRPAPLRTDPTRRGSD
ncbi:unnamed protein product, partial [Prorocentrum cordatum]